MPAFRLGSFACAAAFAAALTVLIPPATSHAYTPEQEQACTPDAMRLCGQFIPNVDAITACMIQRKSQLSPQCRAHFRPGPEPGEAAGRPTNIKPVATAKKPKPVATKKTTSASKKKKPKTEG
ncbi:hypothetical protein JQ596_16255 [Bradyrhizobium manausense]|uniref:hypothetical protein n=1 Tax=Bradyrhizobium TaxID=374 RepID=UPI001BAB620A|nr:MULTISPECIES: hypothetical protein [Bradyrhizobium]MBR0827091.1 hypothetical protein [Bradyrhizobium manausense]UVO28312.1 hypothetical protein KUF59_38600 [Bradyrhizobium arachidis]